MMNNSNAIRTILLSLLVGLTGCFSLSREQPSQKHYVLGGSPPAAPAAPAEDLTGLAIGLRQLQLAEYLETPLIVVRQGSHQIHFSEFSRWGEDLGGGVSRAIAGYLSAGARFRGVDVVPWSPLAQHDYLIQVQLLRFEGLASESGGGEGEAVLLATWQIIGPRDGGVLSRGTTDYRAPGWVVGDYDDLVTRLDSGLQELSGDLVASLEELAGV